uniref:Uncharacterized protein n=1 Tax=Psilocybe cubensis TaxID=181762 RepID=A0A8H7Y3R9_PSICU
MASNSDAQTYIVVLRDGVSTQTFLSALQTDIKAFSADTIVEYEHALNGFAGKFTESHVETLKANPDVKYIEKDSVGEAFAYQNDATWGLGRLSRIAPLPIGDKPTPNKFFYHWDPAAGSGVDIYVVDSGVDTTHPAFEGRASWGKTQTGTANKDLNGHGTHVAGTAISKQLGVAKAAKVIAVKVMEQEVKALDWVIENVKKTKRPSVVNMSLGGPTSQAVDDAVKKLFDAKITTVAAAGNDNKDAKTVSPARSPYAITVGACNIRDKKWSGSNYGEVVNIFAPGEDVDSTWLDKKTKVMSGTSMAAPHVSGLMAYLISLQSKVPQNFWAYAHVGVLKDIRTPFHPTLLLCKSMTELNDVAAKTANLLAYNNHYDLNGQAAFEEEINEGAALVGEVAVGA